MYSFHNKLFCHFTMKNKERKKRGGEREREKEGGREEGIKF
jgi:hypothetical protein